MNGMLTFFYTVNPQVWDLDTCISVPVGPKTNL